MPNQWLITFYKDRGRPEWKPRYLRRIGKHSSFTHPHPLFEAKPTWGGTSKAVSSKIPIGDTPVEDYSGPPSATKTGCESPLSSNGRLRNRFKPERGLRVIGLEVEDIQILSWEERNSLLVSRPLWIFLDGSPLPDTGHIPRDLLAATCRVANHALSRRSDRGFIKIQTQTPQSYQQGVSYKAVRHCLGFLLQCCDSPNPSALKIHKHTSLISSDHFLGIMELYAAAKALGMHPFLPELIDHLKALLWEKANGDLRMDISAKDLLAVFQSGDGYDPVSRYCMKLFREMYERRGGGDGNRDEMEVLRRHLGARSLGMWW